VGERNGDHLLRKIAVGRRDPKRPGGEREEEEYPQLKTTGHEGRRKKEDEVELQEKGPMFSVEAGRKKRNKVQILLFLTLDRLLDTKRERHISFDRFSLRRRISLQGEGLFQLRENQEEGKPDSR